MFLSIATARAADRVVTVETPPPLAKNAAAIPRIAAPADDAETKINAALRRLDGNIGKAIAECAKAAKEAHTTPDWERTAEATMRGPGFLSLSIVDSTDCGGAHPNASTMSIVYDLQTGGPVDWTKLLPAALTGKVALQAGADGTKMVTLSSKRLTELYLAGYRNPDAECRQAMKDAAAESPPAMMVWLDAKAGGLAVQFDVAHVIQACADPVTIPSATLRQLGASPRLVDAIDAAQGAR
jgi:hypothetical protein